MDTETPTTAAAETALTAEKSPADAPMPPNRLYVFAKTCTNDHGHFAKGDKARGAFAPELVASYLAAGVLVPVCASTPAKADSQA